MAQRIYGHVDFAAVALLATIMAVALLATIMAAALLATIIAAVRRCGRSSARR